MKTNLAGDQHQLHAQQQQSRVVRMRGRFAIATAALLLVSCGGGGGGGDSTAPPVSAAPLVWDQTQATWDNVTWQ